MSTQGDCVYSALNATETTETDLGTVTIPAQGVSRIVGVWGEIMQPAATAGETNSGFFKLKFKSVPGTFKFPCTQLYGPAGTLAANATKGSVAIIPVNIPVPGNETITISITANKALTGTGEGFAGVIME